MTREEAIMWLQAVKHHRTFLILNADEAIDIAIKAINDCERLENENNALQEHNRWLINNRHWHLHK